MMTMGASILTGVLLATGAVATALIGIGYAERTGRRVTATVVAAVWWLLVFLPLVWGILGGQSAWYAEAIGAYDFAGALPFQIGGGVAFLAITVMVPRTSDRPLFLDRLSERIPVILLLVTTVAAWTAWLVLMELDLNTFVVRILGNTTVLALSSLAAALVVERIRTGAMTATGCRVGVLTGLAAATGTCVFLEPLAAAAIGVIAGVVAGLVAFPRGRLRVGTLASLGAVTQLSGGICGLLLLGLLEQSRGFFYTGAFTLPVAQLTAVVCCLFYAAVVAFPLVLIARRSQKNA